MPSVRGPEGQCALRNCSHVVLMRKPAAFAERYCATHSFTVRGFACSVPMPIIPTATAPPTLIMHATLIVSSPRSDPSCAQERLTDWEQRYSQGDSRGRGEDEHRGILDHAGAALLTRSPRSAASAELACEWSSCGGAGHNFRDASIRQPKWAAEATEISNVRPRC